MAHRSRIPVRRAVMDENKLAAGKEGTEPIKAVGKGLATAQPKNAPVRVGAANIAKTFGAPTAASRARSALGEISNVRAQGIVSKLTKPEARLQAKPLAKPARATGIAKPASVRPRPPIAARSVSAIRPAAAVLGSRPISKPTQAPRRVRPVASAPVATTKRAKAAAAQPAKPTSVLGKHTRSGRTTQVAEEPDTSRASEPEPESESTAVSSSVASLRLESKSPAGDKEIKFVEEDTVDYAMKHTGLMQEQPIQMSEIAEFDADVNSEDMTLVPEFSDDIFGYMRELEVRLMPDANYMAHQPELTWPTRGILVEWLVQVHQRFNLLPETLFLCINFVDRFLSTKQIAINKIQLVGAVALLLASKYEEMHVPSIKDIEYMVENNFSEDEILRAERYILRMLNFDLGWPGPLSFLRRVSKADEYEVATRTVAKYLIEATLVDERFIGVPCSKVAACAHYLALRFLNKGPWTRAHAYYSGYFESELLPLAEVMLEVVCQPRKHRAIFEKYADRRFLHASEKGMAEIQAKGVLFDMDGTLVDTTACVEQAWRLIGQQHGVDTNKLIKQCHGRPCLDTIKAFFPASCHTAEFAHMFELSAVDITDGVSAVPGAHSILPAISRDRWAVVTAASRMWAQKRLQQVGLPLPITMVTSDDIQRGKPHPEGYLKGAELLGLDVRDVVVFEDAVNGVKAGVAAGATVVAVLTSTTREELANAGAHYIVNDFTCIDVVESKDHIALSLPI
ncbi:B-type cyclin [Coemansia sp. RSA 989]|nr:B-type cyclin [Coemansia sp. RSA 989]